MKVKINRILLIFILIIFACTVCFAEELETLQDKRSKLKKI